MDQIIRQVLEQLQMELPALIRSGQPWQAEIHGKGQSVQIKIAKITQFPTQFPQGAKLLDEGR